MSKLPVCKGKEAVRAFEKYGWYLARYIDDHFILKKQGERFLYQFQIIIRLRKEPYEDQSEMQDCLLTILLNFWIKVGKRNKTFKKAISDVSMLSCSVRKSKQTEPVFNTIVLITLCIISLYKYIVKFRATFRNWFPRRELTLFCLSSLRGVGPTGRRQERQKNILEIL